MVNDMNITMSAKIAKLFVKAIEKLNEESLIVFNEDGIKTKIVDGDNSTLLDVRIPKDSVNDFSFNGASATEVGVVIARVKDLTKTLTTKDSLEMEYDIKNPTWLKMTANGVERKVRLLNSTHMKRVSTPATEHHWSASLPMKEVKAFLTSIGKTDKFEISVKDKSIYFKAVTDDGEVLLDFDNDSVGLHKEDGDYKTFICPIKFLNLISATGQKTILDVKGSDDSIVEVIWSEADMNFHGWVAPLANR
tara:strand:- start:6431 stop:7177 length:747 start_codon:yes stop_codon:yes gene_type:complete